MNSKGENIIRVLFFGDMVGKPALDVMRKYLLDWRKELKIDVVIANGENLADGSGITVKIANELFRIGIDVVTSGDHIWRHRDFVKRFDEFPFIIRPANFPVGAPGKGYTILASLVGVPIAVINLIGRVFMHPLDCPFRTVDGLLEQVRQQAQIIIVDIHAEATSEKLALGYYLDGRVTAVLGTHTHIPTADVRILPKGTAYITDVGMVGPQNSILGRESEKVIYKFLTGLPVRFPVADFPVLVQAVVIDIDKITSKAVSITRWETIAYA